SIRQLLAYLGHGGLAVEGGGLTMPVVQASADPPRAEVAFDAGSLGDDPRGLSGLVQNEIGPPQADQVECPAALLRRVPQLEGLGDVVGRRSRVLQPRRLVVLAEGEIPVPGADDTGQLGAVEVAPSSAAPRRSLPPRVPRP